MDLLHKPSSGNRSGEIMFIKKEVQDRGGHGCGGHVSEGKEGFVENDMSRNENAVRLELKAPIAFVL
jgi:hypothetical protein